jgi:hypothetical protein
MRTWTCAAVFIFLMIVPIGGTVVHALPWCGCGYCYMQSTGKCTCGYPYYWCLEDLQALQLQTSVHDVSAETYSTSLIATPHVAEKVYLTSGRKCLQNRTALRLLGNIREQSTVRND